MSDEEYSGEMFVTNSVVGSVGRSHGGVEPMIDYQDDSGPGSAARMEFRA